MRNFTYDGVNDRLTAQDLHFATDTTFGTYSYTYDPAGNVTQQVDPLSQIVNYTYDKLNRKLSEDFTGQVGTEVTYTYDSCTNGVGRMCVASSTGARATTTYDTLGRVTSATTTVGGIAYGMSYSSDRQGNLTSITYPDYTQVSYGYNTAGLLDSILYKPAGGTWTTIVSNFDYSPTDQVIDQVNQNHTETTNTLDPKQLYRLVRKQTCAFGCAFTNPGLNQNISLHRPVGPLPRASPP